MIVNNLKNNYIIFYLTFTLLNLSCIKPKDNSSINERVRDDWYNRMINKPVYSNNFELLPANIDDFILRFHRYSYEASLEYILTIRKKDGEYFFQLIHKQERYLEEKYRNYPYNSMYFKVVEKKLNKVQKDIFQKGIKDMIELKTGDLDSNFHSYKYFDMFLKNGKNIKAFRGLPNIHSYRSENNWYINKKKDKILRFIGQLLHYGNMKNNEKKVIYRIEDDTVLYSFYVQKFQDWRELSFYYNNKKVKDDGGIATIKIHKNDTINIFNRVKIKETLWDGTIREY